MEYVLLKAGSIDAFNDKVNDHLLDGWTLYGSPQVSKDVTGIVYVQALTRTIVSNPD